MVALGFLLILLAGMSDGSFYLPSKYTRKWQWEHFWAMFAVGFFVINWILTFIFIPNIFEVYASVASKEIIILLAFGALWGLGAILFGTANNLLGMAIAYPLGLGSVALVGAMIPLLTNKRDKLLTLDGLFVVVGLIIAIVGIVICSRGYKAREEAAEASEGPKHVSLAIGLPVAIFAGVFSALINIGYSRGQVIIDAAIETGVSPTFAATALWSLFFTTGFLTNIVYCLFLMVKRNTLKEFWGPDIKRNLPLGLAMGALFICAIYVYSMGVSRLGSWGEIPGWVLFMSVDIITGNLLGIWTGEWLGAPAAAIRALRKGMIVLLVAIAIVIVAAG
jgi:L-rhamnose-H+ transport protein